MGSINRYSVDRENVRGCQFSRRKCVKNWIQTLQLDSSYKKWRKCWIILKMLQSIISCVFYSWANLQDVVRWIFAYMCSFFNWVMYTLLCHFILPSVLPVWVGRTPLYSPSFSYWRPPSRWHGRRTSPRLPLFALSLGWQTSECSWRRLSWVCLHYYISWDMYTNKN